MAYSHLKLQFFFIIFASGDTYHMNNHDFLRRVLVMEYINGIPILSIGDEMAKRGINPHGKIAEAAKQ